MTPFEKTYWNRRYANFGNSGYGSYGEQLEKKLEWLFPLDFKTVTEIGCGDFNFGSSLLKVHPAHYIGYDVSEVIVARNNELFPEHQFIVTSEDDWLPGDLLMCVDVLFHVIDDDDCEKLLQKLEKTWIKYLVLTAYERDEKFENHVRIRKFDPSRFGEPIFREVVEEDGQLYFYIFKKK